eukprot:TRINITY_DN650_c0_g1_i1.p1 TRINITY_DN650_c0_g1~~TRINITY_DN650_c0_g1_i1.p1  ORF type:complete len:572 (-),score=138.56 TRINITY_DN650_c0_g1_i1:73-1788(-)
MAEPAQEPQTAQPTEEKMSKNALKKQAQKEAKEARKAANKSAAPAASAASAEVTSGDNFGSRGLNQSQSKGTVEYTPLRALCAALAEHTVTVRGRVHTSRGKGKLCFIVLREGLATVQCVVEQSDVVSRPMVNFANKLNLETIVDVSGIVKVPSAAVSTSQPVELLVTSLFVVSGAATPLPLLIEDAARPHALLKAQKVEVNAAQKKIDEFMEGKSKEDLAKSPLKEQLAALEEEKEKAKKYVVVEEKTRLDNRVIDLRTPTSHAVFRIQSAVGRLFREFLYKNDFVEIHSPKLIGCASEGGSAVFQVKYFDGFAYLAQSPQLYKQMAVAGDLSRVFEIAPVFRAENSKTHRHLTEFVGLDLEMAFLEHYHEVLDVIMGMLSYIFEGLERDCKAEIAAISQQFPVTPLVYKPFPRIEFPEAVALLRGAGITRGDHDDFCTTEEILLGKLMKEKYHTDVYVVDKFPESVRPFYTMPDPSKPGYSNSYDIFLRGQEISSGAQRIHDPELLTARASEKGVAPSSIQAYIDSFKYGAPPHAGCGIGLERVVMLYLGLKDVRQTSMFPRDPYRTTP